MTHLLKISSLLVFTLLTHFSSGQNEQTLRGTLRDTDTQQPIVGATIFIPNSDPFVGTNSDIDGVFILSVPVGRIDIKISAIGYEDLFISNYLINSGREANITLEMQESIVMIEAAEVVATENPSEVMNEMATVSARTFSVEETSRYAGSFNDPARMVAGFAGVTSDAEGDNDIVVRGNSPKGIQWRLEGIEIPNPNHFSDEGSTGGPINALNSDLLANSDFYSGAFAPEFGNAYSGLFDIRLRNGNPNKQQYAFGIGVLGTDVTAEGPFKNGGRSSYLVNYRYSSLALLDQAGIVDFDGVPKYQDAAFKLNFPTKNAGVFAVFGLMGRSSISGEEFQDEEETILQTKDAYSSGLSVIGTTHTLPIGDKSYLKSSINFSENHSRYQSEERNPFGEFYEDDDDRLMKSTVRAATTFNHKINSRHKIRTGVIYSQHFYDLRVESFDEDLGQRQTYLNQTGEAGVAQGFLSWKFRASENLTFTSGAHVLSYLPNSTVSVEPRVGARWQVSPKNTISAGFGLHSKIESITNYQAQSYTAEGEIIRPNENMDIPKARHYVLGYERQLSPLLFAKAEIYYQQLYDIAIDPSQGSTFSLLNSSDWFTTTTLENNGTGTNYGVEFTLERYFNEGFFFMTTVSLYESKYVAQDGKERNSAYNGNYVGNLLGGKEFSVGDPSKKRTLSVNARISLIGGRHYTPIDLEASRLAGESIFEEEPFTKKADDVFIANIAVSLRRDRPKATHEVKLDLQNATNNQARLREFYDADEDQLTYSTQLSLLPVLSYRISF